MNKCSIKRQNFGSINFKRSLIEISSFCRCDCLYCGIRCSNKNAHRRRLSEDEILDSCRKAFTYAKAEALKQGNKDEFSLGWGTFVLQGGEDLAFSKERVASLIKKIKDEFPRWAVTLSLGERDRETYAEWKKAGADRYLLRHETANEAHYAKLHDDKSTLKSRKQCLFDLQSLGFETGSGFLVGSPYQTNEILAEDILFLLELQPKMIGIGPFIAHKETPFADKKNGSAELTLFLISLLRILFPTSYIPATTALETLLPNGKKIGLEYGANVYMPNFTPPEMRKTYDLYEGKTSLNK